MTVERRAKWNFGISGSAMGVELIVTVDSFVERLPFLVANL